MTAPALARGQTGRRYVWPPNTDKPELVVPSVTTILSQLSKPALTNWAAKSVAEYAVENVLHWEKLPAADAVDLLKRAPYRNMTKKGDIGTAVHTAMESWNGTEVVLEDLDLLPYVGAAVMFLQDEVSIVLHSEATIFNRTYAYAGTCDGIVALKDGRRAILDWKTGKAIYPEAALQLCAYANGEFIGDLSGDETTMYEIDVGIVIHLPGDGSYTAREVELTPRLWRTFQALRTLQRWRDDYEADALGKTHKGSTQKVDEVAAKRRR
jgi:hypothetical protein